MNVNLGTSLTEFYSQTVLSVLGEGTSYGLSHQVMIQSALVFPRNYAQELIDHDKS